MIEFTTRMKWTPELLAQRLFRMLIGSELTPFAPHRGPDGAWILDAAGNWLLTVDDADDDRHTRAALRHRHPETVTPDQWNVLRRMIAWRLGTVDD